MSYAVWAIRIAAQLAALLATGLLISASWLASPLWWVTWLGLGLLFALLAFYRGVQAFLAGWIVGCVALGIAFHWAPQSIEFTVDISAAASWCVFALMIACEAIPFGLIALLTGEVVRCRASRLWAVPVAWVALEHYWPKVFPWMFAHSQTEVVPLLQIAEVLGAGAISFCVIAVAAIPAGLVCFVMGRRTRQDWRSTLAYASGALTVLLGAWVFGHVRQQYWETRVEGQPAIRAAVIQVDPSFVESVAKMRSRTQRVRQPLDLVCWPESTIGTYSLELNDFRDEEQTMRYALMPCGDFHPSAQLACELLVGGKCFQPGQRDEGPYFQTAFLLQPDESISGRYLKRTLMPIGEYVPGQQFFPALMRMANLDESLIPGDSARPLVLANGARVGVLICYEDTVAANARQTVVQGAQVLFSLMNASAFENPLTLEQHMRLALLRSVENRRSFARCAATGVSCFITPTGRIVQRAEAGTEATLVADLPLIDELTIYTRFGFLFTPACLILSLLFVGRLVRQRLREARQT